MKWEVITQMSQSPKFPAHFVAETLNDNSWTISDPIGHLGSEFWYVSILMKLYLYRTSNGRIFSNNTLMILIITANIPVSMSWIGWIRNFHSTVVILVG